MSSARLLPDGAHVPLGAWSRYPAHEPGGRSVVLPQLVSLAFPVAAVAGRLPDGQPDGGLQAKRERAG